MPQFLENLKLPEYRARYRTRRELRGHPASKFCPPVRGLGRGPRQVGPRI